MLTPSNTTGSDDDNAGGSITPMDLIGKEIFAFIHVYDTSQGCSHAISNDKSAKVVMPLWSQSGMTQSTSDESIMEFMTINVCYSHYDGGARLLIYHPTSIIEDNVIKTLLGQFSNSLVFQE